VIRLDIIKTVFRKELREMLRDRRSLAVMFGLPLVLYPLLAIGISTLASSKQQELSEIPARVGVVNPSAAPELVERLRASDTGIILQKEEDFEGRLKRGAIDALVDIPDNAQADAVAGKSIEITIRLDRSRSSAEFTQRKINKVLDNYERWVQAERLKKYNAPAELLEPLKSTVVDVASGDKVFGRLFSQMLPLLLLMTGMLGALFPALNATTTERELGTLETLLVTPAGRMELLLAKGALVLISALLTAGLNMLSMSLVLLKSLSMLQKGLDLTISPSALVLSYIAAVPALIFFSTVVLIVGLLARNFREANSFATPVMLLPLISTAIGIMEPEATAAILITPVASTTVIIREVLTGRASIGDFALAFFSSCLYAGIVLSMAARLFSSEQLVNPAWEPVSLKGFRRSKSDRPRRVPPIDAAMALFAVSLVLLFYLATDAKKHGLMFMISVNELLVILLPTLLFAYLGRWDWVRTFSWRKPTATLLVAAALFAVGVAPLVQLVSQFQQSFWPQESESARLTTEILLAAIRSHPILTAIVVGTLAGFCEEMLFRGPIQAALLKHMPPWAAICIAGLLFGAFHFDLNGLPIRTILGILLGWLTWRTGSIFPSMLAHGLYDATQLAMAAVHVHWYGLGSDTAPAHLTRFDWIALGTGAGLIVGAVLLFRGALQERKVPEGN
jgi:sodium transport system permease protein